MTPCSEQRKKYSNSNIIMHETSQYHVQVRPAPKEHPQSSRADGETEAQGDSPASDTHSRQLEPGTAPHLSWAHPCWGSPLQSWVAHSLGGIGALELRKGHEGTNGQCRPGKDKAWVLSGSSRVGNPCGKETVILAPKQGTGLRGRR